MSDAHDELLAAAEALLKAMDGTLFYALGRPVSWMPFDDARRCEEKLSPETSLDDGYEAPLTAKVVTRLRAAICAAKNNVARND
jgi:hypothetical protein